MPSVNRCVYTKYHSDPFRTTPGLLGLLSCFSRRTRLDKPPQPASYVGEAKTAAEEQGSCCRQLLLLYMLSGVYRIA